MESIFMPPKEEMQFDSVWFSYMEDDDGSRYTVAVGMKKGMSFKNGAGLPCTMATPMESDTMSPLLYNSGSFLVVSIGVARCSAKDQFVKRIGRVKALGRATQSIHNHMKTILMQRVRLENMPLSDNLTYDDKRIRILSARHMDNLIPGEIQANINQLIATQLVKNTDYGWKFLGLYTAIRDRNN